MNDEWRITVPKVVRNINDQPLLKLMVIFFQRQFIYFLVTYFLATFDTCFLKPYTTGKRYKTFSCNFFRASTFFFPYFDPTIGPLYRFLK